MASPRRRLPRTGALLAAFGLTATGLTGCQLFEIQEPEYIPSAIEQCVAAQSWVVDPASLRDNVAQRLAELGVSGEIEVTGGQTLDWDIAGNVTLGSDVRVTVTNAGPPLITYEMTVVGESGGSAVFTGEVGIPRKWSEAELRVTEQMTEDEVRVDELPWSLGRFWIDDTVGLAMQCDPATLEVEARGTKLGWTFHPEGWTPPVEPVDEATEEPAEGA